MGLILPAYLKIVVTRDFRDLENKRKLTHLLARLTVFDQLEVSYWLETIPVLKRVCYWSAYAEIYLKNQTRFIPYSELQRLTTML